MFMQAWQFSAVVEEKGNKAEHAKFFETVWRSFQAVMFLCGAGIIALTKPMMKVLPAPEFYGAWIYVPL